MLYIFWMGEHQVRDASDENGAREFVRAMLDDIKALEILIDQDLIERDVRRVGVEQEMYIVDWQGYQAPIYDRVLQQLNDDRFTTELARFNLEANLAPDLIDGGFLRNMEKGIYEVLEIADRAAQKVGANILLTGILPTLRDQDISYANLTPELRYRCLNDTCIAARGGKFTLVIDGVDRFEASYDSAVIEGASTSFQIHLQVAPEQAAAQYNLAQLITAPLLAVAANSAVLLNRRVWHETRVALFERAIEYRSRPQLNRRFPSRVGFGESWVRDSVLEVFRENAMRHHVIMLRDPIEDPFKALDAGQIPELGALSLHNGTVWRWNRPCYGITNGKPHLRIENRALPAGPTVIDEVANAALFYGLMEGFVDEAHGIPERIEFEDARNNLIAAAKYGLNAEFTWLDKRRLNVRELLEQTLVPVAHKGLEALKVSSEDIARYLGAISGRIEHDRTGAQWLLDSLSNFTVAERREVCRQAVTKMLAFQSKALPIYRWELISPDANTTGATATMRLRDVMTTDLFTVRPEDLLELAASMMEWKHFRHVPVENAQGELVGLLTTRHLIGRGVVGTEPGSKPVAVSEVMQTEMQIMPPNTPVCDAFELVLKDDAGCLLVVSDNRLLGIVTERDLLEAAVEMLAE